MKKYLIDMGAAHLCPIFIIALISLPFFGNENSRAAYFDPPNNLQTQYLLKGTVKDLYGPMPGVHIHIKGTKTGTFTNEEGKYSITVAGSDTLVFSYIGYQTMELPILGRPNLDVEMQSEVTELQEVEVNAGYYTVKERERTGSISRVKAEEIELQPIVSPLEALQGRMAGVEVEQSAGITGLAPTIRIRGINSLRNDGNYPLYIVDGIPINSDPLRSGGGLTNSTGLDPLSTLNLYNIQSIEVLKDADATAIYGSRGSNGVVLITTKKKRTSDGKTLLAVNVLTGISEVANKVKLLNTRQYTSMRKMAFENDGVIPNNFNAPDLILWDQNDYTDWQEVLFGRAALMTNVNMSISGGDKYTSYLIGGSYHNQGSVFPGNFDYNRITANFNLNHHSQNNKFQLNISGNYGVDDNSLFFGNNFVTSALTTPPNAPPIYGEDGSLNWENWVGNNPLAVLEQPQDIKSDNLLANMGLTYKILKGLNLKTNLGYSKLNSEEQIRFFKEAYRPSRWDFIKLRTNQSQSIRQSWIVEPQMTYDFIRGKLEINTLAGATLQDSKNTYLSIEGSGYADKSLMENLGTADEVRIFNYNNIHYKYAALFGRVGLSYDKKYFLNMTGRRDGSSRFGPDKRFSNFGAIGAAWIFSEEKAVSEIIPFLSFGKIRGSYGTTGSDQIGDYAYLDTYETTDGPGGLYPTQLFNPDFSWETNKKLETALQLGLFRDRINLNVSWYRNRSSNQLVGYPLPATTGFTSVLSNLPALVQNSGWELQFSAINVTNEDLYWQTSLNMTFPDNKLVSFDNINQTSYKNRYKVGYPLNIRKLYQFDGIDPDTGFYRVVDVNEDNRFNFDDRVVVNNMGRKYYAGINNHFRFKGLSLQFLLEYVQQNNLSSRFKASAPGTYGNKPIEFLNAWEQLGDNQDIQKLSQSGSALKSFSYAANSSIGVEDASFLRLKNLSLTYQLPPSVLDKLKVESMNLFFRGQNLFTMTNYKGLDPQGGRNVVPPLRTISCGIQLNL